MGKTACYVYQIGYQYQLLLNNEYQILEKFDIGTPLVFSLIVVLSIFLPNACHLFAKVFHYTVVNLVVNVHAII